MAKIILYILGVYLILTAIGWILGLMEISKGPVGTIFNICLMLFRKIWPIVVILFLFVVTGGIFGWF